MGGIRLNTREELSLRQVLAAVALSGLSLAEAQAGEMDWRWGLVGVAVSVPLFAWVIMRLRSGPIYKGVYGVVLTAVYTGWSALTLGHVLGQAAHRLELTGGSQGVQGWLILLLALPVAWMSWGKAAAFFRGGEIYWMVLVAVLAVVALLTTPQVTVSYLWTRGEGGWTSALEAAGTVATAAWVLPYLYKTSPEKEGETGAVIRWLLLLGVVGVGLAVLTQGVLGQAAQQLTHPFFVTTGVMGKSARTEGLLSALWLICDLVWAGLLARVWGGGKGPVACVALGAGIALTGWTDGWPQLVWPVGNLVLAALAALRPRGEGKIVVKY